MVVVVAVSLAVAVLLNPSYLHGGYPLQVVGSEHLHLHHPVAALAAGVPLQLTLLAFFHRRALWHERRRSPVWSTPRTQNRVAIHEYPAKAVEPERFLHFELLFLASRIGADLSTC